MSRFFLAATVLAAAWLPCQLEAAVPGRAALLAGMERELDQTGFVEVKAAAGRSIIDVREGPAGERCRIPGALAMPLYAVKARSFLASRPVVLVNEGFCPELLLQERKKLLRSGFRDVAVLRGGMAAWLKASGRVEGVPEAAPPVVPARAYYADKDLKNVLVVALHGTRGAKAFADLPGAIVLPARSADADVVSVVKDLVARRPELVYVVAAAEDEATGLRLARALDTALPLPVFRLENGLAGFQRFLDEQLLSWSHKGHVTVGGCPTCR